MNASGVVTFKNNVHRGAVWVNKRAYEIKRGNYAFKNDKLVGIILRTDDDQNAMLVTVCPGSHIDAADRMRHKTRILRVGTL